MTRRYRRYRKQQEHPVAGLLVLIAIGFAFWAYKAVSEDQSVLYFIIPFIILVLGLAGLLVAWRYRRTMQKKRALDIVAIDSMDPLLFEEYIATLLRHRGFDSVELTERFDLGVDIVATKDGVRWGVQVKRYSGLVKAEAVRQVFTALVRYKCDRAMVVTNSSYSRPAQELAADNNCLLIDRDMLAEWIVDFQKVKTTL